MQIKLSEASLTLHIWRLGGLWGAYRALWERSWSLWSVMNLLLATSLPSRRVILCGIYMVFSHPVFSSLFHRAQHISILRKQCNFWEWYKSINFLHFFHQFRLTFKNPCKYHANRDLRVLSDALYVTLWGPLGRLQGSVGALLDPLERHETVPGHLNLL